MGYKLTTANGNQIRKATKIEVNGRTIRFMDRITVRQAEIAAAKVFGAEAYDLGINAPILDANIVAMISGKKVGQSKHILKAWSEAWAMKNIQAAL